MLSQQQGAPPVQPPTQPAQPAGGEQAAPLSGTAGQFAVDEEKAKRLEQLLKAEAQKLQAKQEKNE